MRGSLRGAIVALVSVSPAAALAGGFEVPDNGTRSLGRSGAYVAGVDEPSAIYYNPAALTRIQGPGLTLNLNLIHQQTEFQREPYVYYEDGSTEERDRREIRFDLAKNSAGFFPAPMIFASHNFGWDNVTLGAAIYGPSANGRQRMPHMEVAPVGTTETVCGVYTPCRDDAATENDERVITRAGGQGYMLEEYDLLLAYPSLAAAYNIDAINLSVGLTAQVALLWVDFRLGVDGGGFSRFDGIPEIDTDYTTTEGEDFYTPNIIDTFGAAPTGILGLMWEPTDNIAIGASYRPRFFIKTFGSLDVEFPSSLAAANPRIEGSSAQLDVTMPDIIRLGGRYRGLSATGRQVWDIELNAVAELWSILDGYDVHVEGTVQDDTGVVGGRHIPDLFIARYYQNSVSARLGGSYDGFRNDETGNGLGLRAGTYFETAATTEEWANLDFLSLTRFGGSLGASYHIGPFSIDAAFAMTMSPELTVDSGKYEAIVPLWVCEEPTPDQVDLCNNPDLDPSHPVNNGTYKVGYHIASVGFTYGW
jgi:long-chain fatty acid transport protein